MDVGQWHDAHFYNLFKNKKKCNIKKEIIKFGFCLFHIYINLTYIV